jgi:hypothetical protein
MDIVTGEKTVNQHIKLIFSRISLRVDSPVFQQLAAGINSQNHIGIANVDYQKHNNYSLFRVQKTDVRGQKPEARRQKTEDRKQRTENS